MEPSWSLHLLSEILSAFSTDDPENLRTVVSRVAEAVEAEVAAILSDAESPARWGWGSRSAGCCRSRCPHGPANSASAPAVCT